MNDMGWEKIGTGTEAGIKLFDQPIVNYSDALLVPDLRAVFAVALASAALALYFHRRVGIFLTLIAVISVVGFIFMPQGRLWNARLLPFYYFSLFLLAGLLIGEIGHGVADAVRKWRKSTLATDIAQGLQLTAPIVAAIIVVMMVVPRLPEPDRWVGPSPWHKESSSVTQSYIPGWAEWNYSGYDGQRADGEYYKPAYPEYKSVMEMLRMTGAERGCGRVMWEYEPELDRFGTPMALMLSPMYTNGCMGSMEGLYFESSPTVPYHFLNQRLLSETPSSPMRDIPYAPGLNVAEGITRLQVFGVKYYLAISPTAQQEAAVDPRLTLAASVPAATSDDGVARTWNLYEVANSELVTPLLNLPNVMTDAGSIPTSREGKDSPKHSAREAWLENALVWYEDSARFTTFFANDGPPEWPRVETALDEAIASPTPQTRVTYTGTSDDRITFSVDQIGQPILVKTSYFPNWKAKGATGPYRVTPNLMVVVPTSHDVELYYSRTLVDLGAAALSVVGVGVVGFFWRSSRRKRAESAPETDQVAPITT